MFLTAMRRAALALIAALALVAPAFAADLTLTGTVSYRERIALPANAELAISLVALPGSAPIVSAAGPALGAAPLYFTLNLRSAIIKPDGVYGLTAEIRSAGRILFRTAQPVPVSMATPSDIGVLVNYAPGPLPPLVETPDPLLDIVWTVTSIGGAPALADSRLTFSVAADLRVGGDGGCNSYFTEASFENPLVFGPIAGTRMACAPAIMTQEARFFAALAATAGYERSGDTLQLVDAAGAPLVALIRAP